MLQWSEIICTIFSVIKLTQRVASVLDEVAYRQFCGNNSDMKDKFVSQKWVKTSEFFNLISVVNTKKKTTGKGEESLN